MASFDIVSKIDGQNLDNAINNARKEIVNRYDFNNSETSIDLDKKTNVISITTENDMRLKSVHDVLITRVMKQNIDPQVLDFSKEPVPSGKIIRQDVPVKEGIEKETAKKIVKFIKDSKFKVDVSIMEDQVRVSGKKLDELQAVIASVRGQNFELPLQFINMRS